MDQAGLKALGSAPDVVLTKVDHLDAQQLLEQIHDYEGVIIRSGTNINRNVIEAASRLKVIGRAGVGVDNIDLDAASEKGILVLNAPNAITASTAEHTLALMLAASRLIVRAHNSLLEGNWSRAAFKGRQLSGKDLGIIGFGRIGRAVSVRAFAFGMNNFFFDPYVSSEIGSRYKAEKLAFESLLERADYISLHAASTPETRNMVDRGAFSKMKPGVIFVNVSRGALVDEIALIEALNSGKVRAAALDVFREEPPVHNPLIGMENVIHTPHLGASTMEAQKDTALEIAGVVLDALRGTALKNVVNRQSSVGDHSS